MSVYYKLKMKIGNYIYYGRLTLNISGNSVNGIIEYKNMKSVFYNGIIRNNEIEFSGKFKMFLHKINYIAKGSFNNDRIRIIATTNRGDFEITGICEK